MKKMEVEFPMEKPKVMEEKYQDDGQEKTIANKWYVAQPFFFTHGDQVEKARINFDMCCEY